MGKIFPRKYQFIDKLAVFSVLAVFLTSGVLMASFQKLWARKNIKIYDITGIVPAAAARFIQSKTPRLMKGENIGAFWWKKFYEAQILKLPTGRGGRCDALFVKSILDHMFAKVHWRNDQSYFHDNRNYFSHFQKIFKKKL